MKSADRRRVGLRPSPAGAWLAVLPARRSLGNSAALAARAPLPLAGRGRGWGYQALRRSCPSRLPCSPEHPRSRHARPEALLLQVSLTPRVSGDLSIRTVRSAIDLDDQPLREAREVDDEMIDGNLLAELAAELFQLRSSRHSRRSALCGSAQLTCSRWPWSLATPTPNPSPQGGGESRGACGRSRSRSQRVTYARRHRGPRRRWGGGRSCWRSARTARPCAAGSEAVMALDGTTQIDTASPRRV